MADLPNVVQKIREFGYLPVTVFVLAIVGPLGLLGDSKFAQILTQGSVALATICAAMMISFFGCWWIGQRAGQEDLFGMIGWFGGMLIVTPIFLTAVFRFLF